MDAVSRECRIPIFGNGIALKDTDEEAGQIIHHVDQYKTLNAPESGIMASHKNANEL